MFTTIAAFESVWAHESTCTQALLNKLTDASLKQPVYPGGRTLGRLAWHIAQTIPEMMAKAGLQLAGPGEHEPMPTSAAAIADGYRRASASLVEQLPLKWTDDSLAERTEMYGDMWEKGTTLSVLIRHEAHHRGQMTVLMRQAGLPVSGVYGPSKEEWGGFGMPAPE
ncbi:MAG: DinB family protein [Gemmatimonadaceae bacterium]